MTRQHMLDKHCVRCPQKDKPSPYLKSKLHYVFGQQHWITADSWKSAAILDIGCGCGRNIDFLKGKGCHNILGFDMVGDYGCAVDLDERAMPLFENTADIVLANYIFMFLKRATRYRILKSINLAAKAECTMVVELYPALDSHTPSKESMLKLQAELESWLTKRGWVLLHKVQAKFIAKKVG